MAALSTVKQFLKTRKIPVFHIYNGFSLKCGNEIDWNYAEVTRTGYDADEISCPDCRKRVGLPVTEDKRKNITSHFSEDDETEPLESTPEDDQDELHDMPA